MHILYYIVGMHCFYMYLIYIYIYIIRRDTGNRYSVTGTHAVRRLLKHNIQYKNNIV